MDKVEETSTPSRNISRQSQYLSVVPWQNSEQFIKVYAKLYSNTISDKRWAVDQITVWETRCHSSLPTAIEATVVIVGAVIQDMLLEVRKTLCRQRDVQNLYSMALVRFVNLVLQTEGKNLTILASQHNIPQWIVDLRHDATHASTPSLPSLRMGIRFALRYLEETYWKKEAANVCQIVKTPPVVEEKVIDVISKFKTVQFSLTEEIGDIAELERDLHKIIEKIHSLVKNHNEKFVDALVKPGVFLSAEEILRLLNFTGATIFLEEKELLTLPDKLQDFWLAVIRVLHTADLISYFMEMLLLSLENCTSFICQKTAVAWVIFLLNETYPNAPSSKLSNRFKAKGVHLYRKRLLYASMKVPKAFGIQAFQAVVNRIGNVDKYVELFQLIALHTGMLLDQDLETPQSKSTNKSETQVNKDSIVFTVEDLENDYSEEKLKIQGSKKQNNIWSMAPVLMNFAPLPLGAIISPAIPAQNGKEACEDVDMNASFEDKFIFEENDKEPTVEVKRTPDINIFQDPEIGDMIYSR